MIYISGHFGNTGWKLLGGFQWQNFTKHLQNITMLIWMSREKFLNFKLNKNCMRFSKSEFSNRIFVEQNNIVTNFDARINPFYLVNLPKSRILKIHVESKNCYEIFAQILRNYNLEQNLKSMTRKTRFKKLTIMKI